jgi:2-polyprenyl-3-methyl-5-hydroxy-6-metoxy-1,4-benzoquinol methylase
MNASTPELRPPDPALVFDAINAYQRSAALKAAIELEVFSAIGAGNRTAESIAAATNTSKRGVRILCDYLAIIGFLIKDAEQYSLSVEAGAFLDRNSPAYFGSAAHFLLHPNLVASFQDLSAVVRAGTTTLPEQGTVTPENPLWVDFARQMAPMVHPSAQEIAELTAGEGELKVLEIAAGHGLFGIAIAQGNPKAHITALDWARVLTVATENARQFGVAGRYSTLEGDAFQVEFGGPYDLILVTNFFHHFDPPTCESLMRKILGSLASGGRCVTLDFMPNEDRVTPPVPAAFALMMLGTTPRGDVYTFPEYQGMFERAGFASSQLHSLRKAPQSVIVSRKNNAHRQI